MTPLAKTFRFDGFDFELVQREGDVALFRKSKPTHRDPSYEVVILRKHPEQTFPSGKFYPARESMPPSESWGTEGWSYSDLPSAKTRFNKTVDSRISPTPFPADAPEG